MTVEEFDRLFDEGKTDMTPYLDMDSACRPGLNSRRVNVDFPPWVVDALDVEAKRIGITRQALIKTWIVERLEPKAG
ncbi:MAG: CopG family transcriptional regulator [Coriobacteriia bacterium]|nr:CopG family transcriptional regulator [Coriobacteriia bacterium]